jgi:hypothetical protein
MLSHPSRRDVLKTTAIACAGEFAFLRALPSLSAQEVQNPARAMVQLAADIEPLVRQIEDAPRERILQIAAERVRGGTSYQQLLSAVMLAGVRGIQPRPVGFKFHAVLVVNSAHLASQAARDQDRWLPLFWALDNYKSSQAANRDQGNWVMPPLEEGQVPAAGQAVTSFRQAMDNWDETGADRAVAALARTCGVNEIYEMFWRYGARDFRDIGHKAIFVANSYRTLQTIGFRHAEPILRSLAYALLAHEAGMNPAQGDAAPDRPFRENLGRAARIRADWQRGRVTPEASTDFLAALRTGNPPETCQRVVTMLNDGIDPNSLWDGLFLFAAELLMRQPGIVGIHCVTSTNALHFAYENSANDETRRLMLLQAAAFLPLFRANMMGRGMLPEMRIDTLAPLEVEARTPGAVEDIFTTIGRDKMAAARKTLGFLQSNRADKGELWTAARRLIFAKGNDSHDYKYSSAVLEDYYHATPAWRDRFIAASMFQLRGSGAADTNLYRRMREAVQSV